jgi:hypothetical protein
MSNGPSFTNAEVVFGALPSDGVAPSLTVFADGRAPKGNFSGDKKAVVVENLRGKEDTVTLDTAGFQFVSNRPTKYKNFLDDEAIKQEYYPECAELLRNCLGASRVKVYHHRE